jgi:hypothetical protein
MIFLFAYSFFRELIPNGRYNGQKPSKLVRMKIAAKISKMMARVPEITLVKYSMITKAAISNLTAMSMLPMFFFIWLKFWL